jgi:hypothetical protein
MKPRRLTSTVVNTRFNAAANSSRPNARDDRRFAIQNREGEFVQKFIGTGWETVKREIVWTNDKDKAATWTLDELLESGSGYMDVVCGFAGTRLIEVKKRAGAAILCGSFGCKTVNV